MYPILGWLMVLELLGGLLGFVPQPSLHIDNILGGYLNFPGWEYNNDVVGDDLPLLAAYSTRTPVAK